MQIVVDLWSVVDRIHFDKTFKPGWVEDVDLVKLYLTQTTKVNIIVRLIFTDYLEGLGALRTLAALLLCLHLNISS